MLAHTLSWPCEHLMVIGCKKNTWFQAYVTNLWIWPFHLPHPHKKPCLRSPCQAVTMTTSENVILYDLRTHWNHQTKVPRGILNFIVIFKVIKVKILLFFLAKLTSKWAYLCMELFLLWFTGVQCALSGIELWVYAWMYWIIQHKSVIFS